MLQHLLQLNHQWRWTLKLQDGNQAWIPNHLSQVSLHHHLIQLLHLLQEAIFHLSQLKVSTKTQVHLIQTQVYSIQMQTLSTQIHRTQLQLTNPINIWLQWLSKWDTVDISLNHRHSITTISNHIRINTSIKTTSTPWCNSNSNTKSHIIKITTTIIMVAIITIIITTTWMAWILIIKLHTTNTTIKEDTTSHIMVKRVSSQNLNTTILTSSHNQ